MSTDNQIYSADNQKAAIRRYARQRGLTIVKTYEDLGKSGLSLRNRQGLRQLLADVLSGRAEYQWVLVYDVSRWGRFEDQDEAACYEFLCRRAGVSVEYCTEAFPNVLSFAGSLLKSLKRAMAADFSRKLSVQVFNAKARTTRRGDWAGGTPPYGLERAIRSEKTGGLPHVLKLGEWKTRAERGILVPGRSEEIDAVRKIFSLARHYSCREIANILNLEGTLSRGNKWCASQIHYVLTCPMYAGTNVWARTSKKMQGGTMAMPPQAWIQYPAAFEPIVDVGTYNRAQTSLARRRTRRQPSEEIIHKLRQMLRREGTLSESSILCSPLAPGIHAVRKRFGSLWSAYEAIGYKPNQITCKRRQSLIAALRIRNQVAETIVHACPLGGASVIHAKGHRPVVVINNVKLAVFVLPSTGSIRGALRWPRARRLMQEDFCLLALLNARNDEILRHYLFPSHVIKGFHLFKENDALFAKSRVIEKLSDVYAACTEHGDAEGLL